MSKRHHDISCIIVEDQLPAQRILKAYIKDLPGLKLEGAFTSATEALRFLGSHEVDLIFLDIHLPKLSGIDFLKSMSHPPKIIMTTAFPDYALEGYDLNVTDYLLKPFSFPRFCQAVEKVREQIRPEVKKEEKKEQDIFVKSGYDYIKVNIGDIFFIKTDADYTEIITADQRVISAESLKYWRNRLRAHSFVQVHKSYIVNPANIIKVSGNQIFFDGDLHIPIGRAYKDSFLNNYL